MVSGNVAGGNSTAEAKPKRRPTFDGLFGDDLKISAERDAIVKSAREMAGDRQPSVTVISAAPFPVSVHTTVGYFEVPPYSKGGFGQLTIRGVRVQVHDDGAAFHPVAVLPADIARDLVAQGGGMVQVASRYAKAAARRGFHEWLHREAHAARQVHGFQAQPHVVINEWQAFAAVMEERHFCRLGVQAMTPAIDAAWRHWRGVRAERRKRRASCNACDTAAPAPVVADGPEDHDAA